MASDSQSKNLVRANSAGELLSSTFESTPVGPSQAQCLSPLSTHVLSTTNHNASVLTPVPIVASVADSDPGMAVTTSMVNDAATVVSVAKAKASFVPSLGAWGKPLKINPELKDPIPQNPLIETPISKGHTRASDILPPELKEDGNLRFPWAAKMDPKLRNLHRTTSPTYLEDGTPMVVIPNHVLMQGVENQKEYVIGQFYRCSTPSGGLIHAVTNRIWGKKCKIFTRKIGDFSFMFHIPDEATRAWVLERGLWHIDDCLMFVAPWTPVSSLVLPEITSIPVWVTLKNIPSCLYSDWGISWIASGLGEPMLTNKPRLDPTQMGEAKLMVEVELDKAFPQRIAAADKIGNVSMVSVEYSWIPAKCEKCGQLGHKKSRCLLLHEPNSSNLSSSHISAPVVVINPMKIVDAPSIEISTENATATSTENVSPTTSHGSPSAFAPSDATIGSTLATSNIIVTAPVATTDSLLGQEAELASPSANASANIIQPVGSPDLVTFTSPPLSNSLVNEVENGHVFGSNHFAALDLGVAGFEIGDTSQRTRGGRPLKPTLKVQEMQWNIVKGRKNKGR